MSGERRCGPNVGVSKPQVWLDPDEGWICDQTVQCSKCLAHHYPRYSDDGATWDEAMAAAALALPVKS